MTRKQVKCAVSHRSQEHWEIQSVALYTAAATAVISSGCRNAAAAAPTAHSQTQNRPSIPNLLKLKQLETSAASKAPSWQQARDSGNPRNMLALVSSPQTPISWGVRSESLHQTKEVSDESGVPSLAPEVL